MGLLAASWSPINECVGDPIAAPAVVLECTHLLCSVLGRSKKTETHEVCDVLGLPIVLA